MTARTYVAFLLVGIFLFLTMGFPAHAQGKIGSLEITPAFVEVTIEKNDEQKTVPITLINHSSEFVSLKIFPIDFKQADGTGAISFVGQEGSYSYSLSSFLTFEAESIELGPNEEKEFHVTVTNRQDLSPGGHYAAVVTQLITPEDVPDEAAVAPSVSSLILVRKVGGEQFNLSLKDVDFPRFAVAFSYPRSLLMQFQNEGNIHLVPYGRVEIKDMFGRLLSDGSINTSSLRVFPSSRRDIATHLTKLAPALPISLNTLSIRGQDSLQKTSFIQTETFVYINPWIVPVILLAGYVWYWYKKRVGRVTTHAEQTGEKKSPKKRK